MRDHPIVISLLLAVASVVPSSSSFADIIHADAGATAGQNNGTDWANAFLELQSALSIAQSGDQIWVAAATYLPDYDVGTGEHTSESARSFQLMDGVALLGAFPPGGGDGTIMARDPTNQAYETILSGEIGDAGSTTDNSFHVVRASGVGPLTLLDGFTVADGRADGSGDNSRGGGMINDAANPTITNCHFRDNWAVSGGAVYNSDSSPTLDLCSFANNQATSLGGAVYNEAVDASAALILSRCRFVGNRGSSGGAINISAVFSDVTANGLISNCTFSGNFATNLGGALYYSSSAPWIVNCSFVANESFNEGGGAYLDDSEPTFMNCLFWANVADNDTIDEAAQIFLDNDSTALVHYSVIDSLVAGGPFDNGHNVQNLGTDPLFVRAPDDGGDGWGVGDNDDYGDLRLQSGSPAIDSGHSLAPIGPLDLDGHRRLVNDPDTPDTGLAFMNATVDRGAYEFGSAVPACSSDLNGDGSVDLADYAILANELGGPGTERRNGE